HGRAAQAQHEGIADQLHRSLCDRDAAFAHRRILALTTVAHLTRTAVEVVLAGLGAADVAVAAGHRRRGANALRADGANVAAIQPRFAALLAGIDETVAAGFELHLVGAHVEAAADRP